MPWGKEPHRRGKLQKLWGKEPYARGKQKKPWGSFPQAKGQDMARDLSTGDMLADAKRLLEIMKKNPDFTLKDFSKEAYEAEIIKLEQKEAALMKHRQDEIPLLNDRNDQLKVVRSGTTRGRSGVKGYFGPDSSEYEEVGGTRASERKKPVRKTPPTP
jgi:hypothetical protein